MTGSHPTALAAHEAEFGAAPEDRQAVARRLLESHDKLPPEQRYDLQPGDRRRLADATATSLMDLYRCTGSPEVFEALVRLTTPELERRVHARVRYLGNRIDPQEILQDTFVNIYRYPDRFDGSRPGAFRAWSSTIVDNTIRRHLRKAKSGPDVQLRPVELLCLERDVRSREPGQQAIQSEDCALAVRAMCVLLGCYLHAYHSLSERERFVLQMVEVKGLRYAQLSGVLGIRPEALKMVVFRARRRIFERMSVTFARSHKPVANGA